MGSSRSHGRAGAAEPRGGSAGAASVNRILRVEAERASIHPRINTRFAMLRGQLEEDENVNRLWPSVSILTMLPAGISPSNIAVASGFSINC